jgi:DNA adenine methylase
MALRPQDASLREASGKVTAGTMTRLVRPVLKWAGGKSRSLPEILGALPERIETYYEPFIGGAAVFFALASEKRFKKAVLSDSNRALIEVYSGLKKDPEGIIKVLKTYVHDQDEYYRIRSLDPKTLDTSERAARMIFLNKTGYNGLYRVNSRGEVNVPFGRYKKPNFCDEEGLRAASRALSRVTLVVGDFDKVSKGAKAGDAVYFDPPYDPVSKTANFTAYHHEEFGKEDHERLRDAFDRLAARGVAVVLSNSDTEFTNDLFEHWKPKKINVSRPINSKATHRGNVRELLVVSPHRK